jgi:ABC-type glycerol-3-phosphate transport system substrate-binding protein
MLRRVLTLTILVAILLAACTTPSTPTPSQPEATQPPQSQLAQPTETSPATEAVAPPAEEVIIDFWIPSGRGRDEGTAAVVQAFEATHPSIKVKVTSIPFNEFLNTLKVALAGTTPPDAAFTNGVDIQSLAFSGALLPLDDLFTEEDRQDFMPDLIDMVSLNGIAYGIPFEQSGGVMYYNAEYFAAAGVEAPKTLEEVWTWQEFVENVKKVVDYQAAQGKQVWGMVGLNNPIDSTFFAWTMIRSNSSPGSPLWDSISPDWTTVKGYIDTPEALEAYTFYQQLYADGFAPKENIPDAFGTGLAATMFAIPPSAGDLRNGFPALKWDVMPLPYFKTPLTHTGSFANTIAARSDNVEAAKEFVKFFSSPEGFKAYLSVTPGIPGRISVQKELPELQEGYLKLIFDEVNQWGYARPGGPAHSIFNQIIAQRMIKDIALGGNIEEVVAAAVEEAEAQLTQFK